jgi:hypothetical protein
MKQTIIHEYFTEKKPGHSKDSNSEYDDHVVRDWESSTWHDEQGIYYDAG